MKILKIEIMNDKALRVFEQDLGGKNMHIAGEAGQGKTTAISALWDIIEKSGDVLSHGEKKGHIRLTLGDDNKTVIAERKFTAKTNTVVITSDDEKISVGDFKQWVNKLGVDPHRLIQMKPMQQTQILLQAVELPDGVDLEQMDAERDRLAREREDASRDMKRAEGGVGDEPESCQGVDTAGLMEELKSIQEHNTEYNRRDGVYQGRVARLGELSASVERAKKALVDAEAAFSEENGLLVGAMEWLKAKENSPKDDSEIQEALANAGEINETASRHKAWDERSQVFAEYSEAWESLDKKVKAIDKAKKEAVDAAKWPLPGLGIQNGEIIYNGSLLSNCGTSEQMLVCGALVASTFTEDQLRVVRLDGTESMSKADFLALEQVFAEHDIQVLSSRVTRGDVEDYELTIEEGPVQISKEDW